MTATLLTPISLREHVETDLSDAALQCILDSEEAEIVRRYGPHATASETLAGGARWLILARDAASVTQIVETADGLDTALGADAYRLWPGGRIERLDAIWAPRVAVTYTPREETAQRRLALINLCKLAIAYSGLKSEGVGSGDYQATALDYTGEREKLLRGLAPRGGLWFA